LRLLIDTQAFLWWMAGAPRLSASAREAIGDPANAVHFSIASAWEIEIKRAIGKLRAPHDLAAAIKTEGFDLLPVELSHIAALAGLPAHHRDPFDRMLLAQAQVEGLRLVSADTVFRRYGVAPLW